MAKHKLDLELVTPEALLFSAPVDMVVIPGAQGDFGVLPDHAPMISAIRPGVIRTEGREGGDKAIFIAGGFAEVTGERCTVLAEEATDLEVVTVEQAQKRLQDAEQALKESHPENATKRLEQEVAVAKALIAAAASQK